MRNTESHNIKDNLFLREVLWDMNQGTQISRKKYDSLADPSLRSYFTRPAIMSQLISSGLVTPNGERISESEYRKRANIAERQEKRNIQEKRDRQVDEFLTITREQLKQPPNSKANSQSFVEIYSSTYRTASRPQTGSSKAKIYDTSKSGTPLSQMRPKAALSSDKLGERKASFTMSFTPQAPISGKNAFWNDSPPSADDDDYAEIQTVEAARIVEPIIVKSKAEIAAEAAKAKSTESGMQIDTSKKTSESSPTSPSSLSPKSITGSESGLSKKKSNGSDLSLAANEVREIFRRSSSITAVEADDGQGILGSFDLKSQKITEEEETNTKRPMSPAVVMSSGGITAVKSASKPLFGSNKKVDFVGAYTYESPKKAESNSAITSNSFAPRQLPNGQSGPKSKAAIDDNSSKPSLEKKSQSEITA
eukprot:Partr_v1_DN27894_c1_g1_i1_m22644